MGLISIVTINYNNADGLQKTIKSIVNQQHVDTEYIVVDGGSTDGSLDILNQYEKDIDKLIVGKDKGLYDALNIGMQQATGEYLLLVHAGDQLYRSGTLSDLEEKYQNYKQSLDSDRVVLVGNKLVRDEVIRPRLLDKPGALINHTSWFTKTELIKAHEYDTDFQISADLKMYFNLLLNNGCRFHHYDKVVQRFDDEGISNSQKFSDILQNVKEDKRIYDSFNFGLCQKYSVLLRTFITKIIG